MAHWHPRRRQNQVFSHRSNIGGLSVFRRLWVIELQGVSKIYRRGPEAIQALREVFLSIASGEFVAITGKSGCGKSTLLHIIGGLEPVTRGRVILDGRDLALLREPELTRFRRDRVGVVFQSFNLLPLLTLVENVALPRVLRGAGYAEAREAAGRRLAEVGLAARLDHQPHQVSGGEMQRAAIARALINDPAVVLADEPTGNLDSATAAQILQLFVHLHRQWHKTVVLVSHAPEVVSFADRVLRMQDGRLL
jgi:ABC-type lipoprotein export system ATPase subunit